MNNILQYILAFIGLAIFIFLIWFFNDIVAYVLIAGVLSLTGEPVKKFLTSLEIKGFKINSSVAAVITLLGFFLLIGGFIAMFIPLIVSEISIIKAIDYQALLTALQEPLSRINALALKYGLAESSEVPYSDQLLLQATELIKGSEVLNIFNSVFSFAGSFLIALFSVVFISFFFLKEDNMFFDLIIGISPEKFEEQAKRILNSSEKLLSRYFLGLMGQVLLITVLVSISLWFLGVKNALIIGFFAGIINLIPYVGPIFGMSFGLFVTTTSNLDLEFYNELLPLLGLIVAVFLIIQVLDNFVFQPLIFGNSVKAHPLEVFIAILCAAEIAGVTGMILAIPSYTIIRVFAKEFLSEFKIVRSLTKDI